MGLVLLVSQRVRGLVCLITSCVRLLARREVVTGGLLLLVSWSLRLTTSPYVASRAGAALGTSTMRCRICLVRRTVAVVCVPSVRSSGFMGRLASSILVVASQGSGRVGRSVSVVCSEETAAFLTYWSPAAVRPRGCLLVGSGLGAPAPVILAGIKLNSARATGRARPAKVSRELDVASTQIRR